MDSPDTKPIDLKAVVDTNVLAYYLLRTEPFYEDACSFFRAAREVWAPDSWSNCKNSWFRLSPFFGFHFLRDILIFILWRQIIRSNWCMFPV